MGVLFLHNEGYSTMCGHGIIAVTKVVLETGLFEMKSPESIIKIDTPAGLVTAFARVKNNKVTSVCFHNVPSFVFIQDAQVYVPGVGEVKYDIAFGGAFYALVSADALGISLQPDSFRQLIDIGMKIKRAVMGTQSIRHPFENDLNFLYGTIFIGASKNSHRHSRNVCIFAEGEVDRSPTGTGVSARIALHYARNEVDLNQTIEIESIIGSRFKVRALEEIKFGPYNAVIPMVEGRTHITGWNKFLIDPDDELKHGFILR
jgi:trans-L-3-hydroxyproline dehydratase